MTHLHRYPLRRQYPTPPQNYQRDRADEIEPHVTEPPLESNQPPSWDGDLTLSLVEFLQANAPGTLHGRELIKISSNVTEDKVWSERITQLPLELGEGYLPEDEPIEVPTGLNDISDYHVQFLSSDEDGPPPETNLFHCWETEDCVSDIIQRKASLSKVDYETIRSTMKKRVDPKTGQYFKMANFILPLAWRRELWKELFYPIKFTVSHKDPLVREIVQSKMTAIHFIESFIIRVWAELEVDAFPGLKRFVDDFPHFAKVLKGKHKKQDIVRKMRYDQVTEWSNECDFKRAWGYRWEHLGDWQYQIAKSPTIRRNYICAVFDVLLGIWMAPGHCLFHDGWLGFNKKVMDESGSNTRKTRRTSRWASTDAVVPRCIQKQLYFWERLPSHVDTQHEDLNHLKNTASESLFYLDACYIEYRGPFRFKETPCVSEHLLTTEDKKILIYTGWKRLLMLRHLKVLVDDSTIDIDEISNLQLLSRSTQSPEDRSYGEGGDIRYIAYELLQTYFLLFYRHVSESDWKAFDDKEYKGPFYHHTHFLCIPFRTQAFSSEEIARNFRLPSKQIDQRLIQEIYEMFSTPYPQLPASGDFKIFHSRLESVNTMLMEWRPRNIWEALRYQGYSTNSAEVWTSFASWIGIPFAAIVFVCTIISAVTGVIQVKNS